MLPILKAVPCNPASEKEVPSTGTQIGDKIREARFVTEENISIVTQLLEEIDL